MFNFECRRGMKFQSRHIHASGKWNACYLLKANFLFPVFTSSLAAQRKPAETSWDFHFFETSKCWFLVFFFSIYSVSGFLVSLFLSYRFYSPCPILRFFCKFLNPLFPVTPSHRPQLFLNSELLRRYFHR